jgi:hypothetical protein
LRSDPYTNLNTNATTMATPTTTTTNARHGQEQHTLLPMRQEPFFPLASQKELYTEVRQAFMHLPLC